MADLKISQLTSATLPLAGTEVLPIVQSSSTKKVATDDLTVKNVRSNATTGILQIAGPGAGTTRTMTTPNANFTAARTDAAQSFTGDQTLGTGNLIQGTAAKGVNFTANTPAAGMTSQLLNWYEEGTWTATLATGFTTTPTATGYYTRIGRQVTITLVASFGVIVNNGAAITITGVPFSAANPVDAVMSGQRIAFNSANAPFIQLSGTTISFYEVVPSSPTVNSLTSSSGAGNAPVLGNISITYFV